MAIKVINFMVALAGISPAVEQFAGTQGDHRVTEIRFVIEEQLCDILTDYADEIGGKALYRFDVYDGEGGIWSSETKALGGYTVGMELEEQHTRFGGKITIYLVITALSADNKTEIELYSFPAVLRLKNRPEGIYKDGENRESISGLAENTRFNAESAASAAVAAQSAAQDANEANAQAREFAAEIEQKLENGEFDGVSVSHKFDGTILTVTSSSGTTSVDLKGEKGDKGEQGPKGDTGANGKDAVIEQTYNSQSENAQSGKAVAEAVSGCVQKLPNEDKQTQKAYVSNINDETELVEIEDNFLFKEGLLFGGKLPRRQSNGNLFTNTPINDLDCANKKYVDDIVGDIATLLGGI